MWEMFLSLRKGAIINSFNGKFGNRELIKSECGEREKNKRLKENVEIYHLSNTVQNVSWAKPFNLGWKEFLWSKLYKESFLYEKYEFKIG